MRRKCFIVLLLASFIAFPSCEFLSNLVHDDEVVARIGRNRLTRSELSDYIPAGLSSEDSTNLSLQYINSWASELLFQQMAEAQLSKSELDVSAELEDYRRSLLKFRYEQKFINERLDTVVTRAEVEEYYNDHQSIFVLEVPIVKARFMDIMQTSPNLELLKAKMSAESYQDLAEADSIAYSSALKYEDKSDTWVDIVTFSRNFGMDYGTVLASIKDSYIEIPDERGDVKIAYICEMERAGVVAPIDYCEERIRDIIVSARKHSLLSTLERELLENAMDTENLIIY